MSHWAKKLCILIEDELNDIAEKGHVSISELDHVHKLVDMWSQLKTQKAMDDYIDEWDDEYSGNYYHRMPDYRHEASYRRGRDSMGRYTSRDSHSEKDSLKEQLHELSRRIENM